MPHFTQCCVWRSTNRLQTCFRLIWECAGDTWNTETQLCMLITGSDVYCSPSAADGRSVCRRSARYRSLLYKYISPSFRVAFILNEMTSLHAGIFGLRRRQEWHFKSLHQWHAVCDTCSPFCSASSKGFTQIQAVTCSDPQITVPVSLHPDCEEMKGSRINNV